MEEYPKIFNVSTENEVEMETTMETESREEKLRKVEERLLSNRTNERITNYGGVMFDDRLSLSQKIIHLQKRLMMQREEKSTALHYKDNYLKMLFVSRGKFIRKLWRKRSFQDGGCYFYDNYTNLL